MFSSYTNNVAVLFFERLKKFSFISKSSAKTRMLRIHLSLFSHDKLSRPCNERLKQFSCTRRVLPFCHSNIWRPFLRCLFAQLIPLIVFFLCDVANTFTHTHTQLMAGSIYWTFYKISDFVIIELKLIFFPNTVKTQNKFLHHLSSVFFFCFLSFFTLLCARDVYFDDDGDVNNFIIRISANWRLLLACVYTVKITR